MITEVIKRAQQQNYFKARKALRIKILEKYQTTYEGMRSMKNNKKLGFATNKKKRTVEQGH